MNSEYDQSGASVPKQVLELIGNTCCISVLRMHLRNGKVLFVPTAVVGDRDARKKQVAEGRTGEPVRLAA